MNLPGFELAVLHTVDHNFLISTDPYEQKVCNLILTFAIIYNDFKNINWAYCYLPEGKPEESAEVSGYKGQYAAFKLHIFRLYISIMHELFNTIEKNKKILEHQLFKEIEQALPKDVKLQWESLKKFSIDNEFNDDNDIKKILARIRNNLTFHYWQNLEVYRDGYKSCFEANKSKPGRDAAYISPGTTLHLSRFFFADGAIEEAQNSIIGPVTEDIKKKFEKYSDGILFSLYYIVYRFIFVRKYTLKKLEAN